VSAPGVVADPDTGTVKVGLEALLLMERLKSSVPAAWGAKTMLKEAVLPACKVSGKVSPLTLYPLPEKVACVIVTLDPPLLVSVAGKDCVLPLLTDPKLKLVGLTLKVPAVTAVPVREIENVGMELLFAIANVRLSLPADWGENATLNDVLWPAARVNGKLNPLTV
jgi:hypothetical protein